MPIQNNKSILEQFLNYLLAGVAVIKSSKLFLAISAFISVFLTLYVNFPTALVYFFIATTLDTITRIDCNARSKKLKFNPFKKYFWFQIKSDLIRVWFHKVFKEYLLYVIIAFAVDILLLKSAYKFYVLSFKLDLPTAVILFFSANETWSLFENREEAGYKNWLKVGLKACTHFFPETWKSSLNEIFSTAPKKRKINKSKTDEINNNNEA